jgi:signal transduction histidine kinase/ActR/RegA family two-component response regulator
LRQIANCGNETRRDPPATDREHLKPPTQKSERTQPLAIRLHRLLLAVTVLVPALLFVGASWQNYSDVLRESKVTIERTVAIQREHALKVFDTIELVLAGVDEHIADLPWDVIAAPKTSDFLHDLKQPLDQIVSIWITDADGVVRAGSQSWDVGQHQDRDFFRVQQERDVGLYISHPFVGRATNIASFAVSRRRKTADGHFDGILHVAVSPQYFERVFVDIAPPLPHIASLVRSDGEILALEPRLDDKAPSRSSAGLIAAIATATEGGSYSRTSDFDGRRRFFAYRKVGAYPLYVRFGVAESVLLGRWYANVALYGIVTSVASLTLLLVAWLALRRAHAEQQALMLLREESAQRLATEERLRRAEKMEALGQLTGGVAHDFNNLLLIIAGNAEIAQAGASPDASRRLDAVLRAAARGGSLTRQLLAFSRQQMLNPLAVDLRQRLPRLAEVLSSSLRGDIVLSVEVDQDLWRVEIDPAEFELALINIAMNARDAMAEGGGFTVTARNVVLREGTPDGVPDLAGEFVAIACTDTGSGMSHETLQRIFEPFFTTKEINKGTGLGLSRVYGFAQQSGGGVSATSTAGSGTCITLYLPRTAKPVTADPDEASGEAAPAVGRVLLVEDNPEVGQVTSAMLVQLGYEVTLVERARQALEVLAADAPYDLVLSDVVMPGGMTGLDLARDLRRLYSDLPVMLMSGYSEAVRSVGAEFLLVTKPFSVATLDEALRRVRSRQQATP